MCYKAKSIALKLIRGIINDGYKMFASYISELRGVNREVTLT